MKRILASTAIVALTASPILAQVDTETGVGTTGGVTTEGAGSAGDGAGVGIGGDAGIDAEGDIGSDADAGAGAEAGVDAEPPVDAGELGADTSATEGAGATVLADLGLAPEDLIGAEIYDAEDTQVATVDDVITDGNGEASQIVASVGGFLGIGARTVAFDLAEVEIQSTAEGETRIYVPMTSEEIEQMEPFEG